MSETRPDPAPPEPPETPADLGSPPAGQPPDRAPTGPPSPTRAGRTQLVGSQLVKEKGLALLMRLSATMRICRAYRSESQVVVSQLEALRDEMKPFLDDSGEAVLVALDEDIYLNGVRVPVRGRNVRFHRHVVEEFSQRRIAGMRLLPGLNVKELATFFGLFTKPDVYNGPEFLSACLANGADHVLPVIHASTDLPGDDFDFDAGWAPDFMEPQEPSQGAFGADVSGEAGPASAAYAAPRGVATKGFSSAVEGARSLLTTTTLQNGMELKHAKRVVQPLVDRAFAGEPVVVGLTSLTRRDEYTYAHAVNVCLVAVTMGHFLELDRRALADLGVAALLHDVGKARVGPDIHHPQDLFTPEEEVLAKRHTVEGAKLLARTTQLNQTTGVPSRFG